ncbi:hypothetical protein MMC10_001800 [Thelotrema lepadinum]|nr:hypothetical protein [Thelotrema lepadinum]
MDGLHFLEELEAWSTAYELRYMVPADTNRDMAEGTLNIGLFNLPIALRGVGLQFVLTLLNPRLRKAMLFEEPSAIYFQALNFLSVSRRWFIRYLALPRPYFLRQRRFSEHPNAAGYLHARRYSAHPWYIKPKLFARWGPKALLTRLLGGVVPGDEGEKYVPQGYRLTELGPDAFKGKGTKEMDVTKTKLVENSRLGCPFAA